MAKYKKLLVAIDGSPSSMHALEESFKLSKKGTLGVSVAPPLNRTANVISFAPAENKQKIRKQTPPSNKEKLQ